MHLRNKVRARGLTDTRWAIDENSTVHVDPMLARLVEIARETRIPIPS